MLLGKNETLQIQNNLYYNYVIIWSSCWFCLHTVLWRLLFTQHLDCKPIESIWLHKKMTWVFNGIVDDLTGKLNIGFFFQE